MLPAGINELIIVLNAPPTLKARIPKKMKISINIRIIPNKARAAYSYYGLMLRIRRVF